MNQAHVDELNRQFDEHIEWIELDGIPIEVDSEKLNDLIDQADPDGTFFYGRIV